MGDWPKSCSVSYAGDVGAGEDHRAVRVGMAVGDQAAEGAAVRRRLAVRVVRALMDRQPDLVVVRQAGRGLPSAQSAKGRFRVLLDWSCQFWWWHSADSYCVSNS